MTALLWILGAGAALYLIVRFSFVLLMRKPRAKQSAKKHIARERCQKPRRGTGISRD
jgi:hypothetical protein